MNEGQMVFSQLMAHGSRFVLNRCVRRYGRGIAVLAPPHSSDSTIQAGSSLEAPHKATTGHTRARTGVRAREATDSLFGVLEAEVSLTAIEIGLNPYIGVMHADLPFRPSFAADLMEPLRPHVERKVLGFLRRRTFLASSTREGQCRLVPPLTAEVIDSLYADVPNLRKMAKKVRSGLLGSRKWTSHTSVPDRA